MKRKMTTQLKDGRLATSQPSEPHTQIPTQAAAVYLSLLQKWLYLSERQKVELCKNRALALLRVPLVGMVGLLRKDELPVIEDCLSSVTLACSCSLFSQVLYGMCSVLLSSHLQWIRIDQILRHQSTCWSENVFVTESLCLKPCNAM